MENATSTVTAAPKPATIDLDSPDLTHHRLALMSMIRALQNGPKSRERSLVITKLEEAFLWAGQALATDP